ncbi:MAG: class I SAM-dependent methyltransferase [Isosphaeraceae bacterium]|nr:class I SAM-dependent methyltransferase [Isosphaeraceae bacterium]
MAVRTWWRAVRPHLPRAAIHGVACGYREYLRLRCLYEGVRERPGLKAVGFEAVPPPFLRYRVDGSTDLRHFLVVGERIAGDMEAALRAVGEDLASFRAILDFGCGCGRTLLWIQRKYPALAGRLHGTDIDAEAIRWCRRHLGFARFAVNGARPPLDAAEGAFDFVYGISVFTHLDAEYQRAWLQELARVTRPGGIVLLTVHGPSCAERLDPALRGRLLDEGFLFVETDSTRGLFPAWYQVSYQTPAQVRASFGQYFSVLAQIPRGIGDHQDAVVLRREAAGI